MGYAAQEIERRGAELVIVDVAAALAALREHVGPNDYRRRERLDELAPRLVGRSDGLALYVTDRRLG